MAEDARHPVSRITNLDREDEGRFVSTSEWTMIVQQFHQKDPNLSDGDKTGDGPAACICIRGRVISRRQHGRKLAFIMIDIGGSHEGSRSLKDVGEKMDTVLQHSKKDFPRDDGMQQQKGEDASHVQIVMSLSSFARTQHCTDADVHLSRRRRRFEALISMMDVRCLRSPKFF